MITRRTLLALAALSLALPALASDGTRGTRDEAVAMADAAVALYKTEGADAAFAAFMDPADVRFHDRDLYVWALDFGMVMQAHGAKAALVGKDLSSLTDVDGVKINLEAVRVANEQDTGWISYKWQNPTTGAVDKKSSYVVNVNDEVIIGVGVYDE
ncbi:cache domain-containing protein [Rhodobacter sp. Har01]|uniref:cache domain-containing protein n=1 Tax=Rhodobacter sp. Har01 TaxID=2883999 RepID=UPI001D05D3B8|nr:cache domain-containing protein [Rhodobacter sp. Har01]MCB6180185.1 cache domain-containing protein [Rhodobacter sp. Har01]